MSGRSSAEIHAQLGHPVIDADAHWIEPVPVLVDYVERMGGSGFGARAEQFLRDRFWSWYDASPAERTDRRSTRAVWWTMPAGTLDWATAALPGLFRERRAELGIDFAVLYPTVGMSFVTAPDPALRRAGTRAYNTMARDLTAEHAEWLCPVAAISMLTPDEAIEELEYAVEELGHRAIVIHGNQRRTVPAAERVATDPTVELPHYIDFLCHDSPYDYDPFWQRCVDLGISVASHGAGIGWSDRRSTTSYVANHLGMFAAAGYGFCRSLVLGGVPERFPTLRFAFLEGGVGWGRDLHASLVGHWKLRNRESLETTLRPTHLDLVELDELWQKYADEGIRDRFPEVAHSLTPLQPFKTVEELTAQEEVNAGFDEFAAVPDVGAIDTWFAQRFFFGCEAEDPSTAWGVDPRVPPRFRAMLGSDIGHWDVSDAAGVISESWELVEEGLLTEADYRDFTFANAAAFYTGTNPGFFDGTVVADAVGDLPTTR